MGAIEERLAAIEKDLDGQGATIDHMENVLNTIVLPTQQKHADAIERHEQVTEKAADFMAAAGGMWLFVQRAGIVIAAIASVVGLILKLKG